MDKVIRLERFDIHPSEPDAGKQWKLWYRNFAYFLSTIKDHNPDKLEVLYTYVGTKVVDVIEDCADFDDAVKLLNAAYVKPPNDVHSRHLLHSRIQRPDESIDGFIIALNSLASACTFKPVTAKVYRDECVRDSFIRGLRSPAIRARLLENDSLDLSTAVQQARALEQAQIRSESYLHGETSTFSAAAGSGRQEEPVAEGTMHTLQPTKEVAAVRSVGVKKKTFCFNCGGQRHPKDDRRLCPAKNAICHACGKLGHFSKVCKTGKTGTTASSSAVLPACLASVPPSSTITVKIHGCLLKGLLDTGSSDNFVSNAVAEKLKLPIHKRDSLVSMASSSFSMKLSGYIATDFSIDGRVYNDIQLTLLPDSCTDVILGIPFLKIHESVNVHYGGSQPPLSVCGSQPPLSVCGSQPPLNVCGSQPPLNVCGSQPPLSVCGSQPPLSVSSFSKATVPPVQLFRNLSDNCRPIATKSRRFSTADTQFIHDEVQNLLKDNVIEPSNSPWRAQVVVTSNSNGKKRMVVDFSQTINRFTLPDAYPLPRIEDVVNSIAMHRVFSVIDLSKAYYQIEICSQDRPYTAFQAGEELYQFTRIPMGVTNGVSAFQRFINKFIADNKLEGTYAYLDDITVCGRNKEEHDVNLSRFMDAASKFGLQLNPVKSKFCLTTIDILGYRISDGELQPDPERLRPLMEYPAPQSVKALQRCIGLFAYYSKWVSNYSDKIRPLIDCTSFPLSSEQMEAFHGIKKDIADSVVKVIDTDLPLQLETDASDRSIAGTLVQSGRPVAFFSRSLSKSESRHHIVEKEAYAIVESVRKWKHFLAGKHFLIITDQRAVSFLFDVKFKGKIKSDKILRWRMELASYSFDIKHRPGKENVVADALTRVECGAVSNIADLKALHDELIHPGVVRMMHYVRSRNLPFSVSDVRRVTSECLTCAKIKPRFHKPDATPLIRASAPFQRLSVDFKGPLPDCASSFRYIFTVVDEYSRFPFAFACRDMSANTVIRCLTQLFSLFGLPSFIHSDRGATFLSGDVKQFLLRYGIAASRTTPYNPRGNSQCERYNGIIWNTVRLALESRNLPISAWPSVLPDALHSIRSLLCTATNVTPHERLFAYERRSVSGCALPTWLLQPGEVLLRRFGNRSKYEPLVDTVELLEATPTYAHVKFKDGHEDTVALRHLAPCPGSADVEPECEMESTLTGSGAEALPDVTDPEDAEQVPRDSVQLRRSSRIRKPVDRYVPDM